MASVNEVAEMAMRLIDELPGACRQVRVARRLSMRQAAAEAGVSQPTISRLEAGRDVSLMSAVAVLRWLAVPTVAPRAPLDLGEWLAEGGD